MALSRQKFLRLSALGLTAPAFLPEVKAASRIKAVDFVKITKVKPYVFKKATFVKIETDAGVSGWGEADHDHPEIVAKVIDEFCEDEVEGQNPFHSEHIWMQLFFKGEDLGSTGLLPGTIAGIDNALWDLKGKLLNMPVRNLLGSTQYEKVRVYGSYGRSGGKNGQKNAAEMAATGAAFVEQGYTTIKARMQIRQLNVDPDPDPTFEIVREVRKAVGDDVELFVDFNNGYTPAKAIDMGLRLYEHFNIAALEEPVSYLDYPGLRQVVEALPIPVMAGEHEFNKWQMRDLLTIGKVDVINADVIKCAGISECKKISDMAHAFDRPIMVHNARPTLATAASLQLIGAIPNAARVQEYGGRREELGLNDLFEDYFTFKDGYLYIPDKPGLGLTVNEEAMEKLKRNQ
ncbi:MAG: mandelate racemase/muconate lactonizing enzyme family protein [Cyclobacteriaceae bacterium]